jgi:hypothetical protein
MNGTAGTSLHLRPVSPVLREQLRALARADGKELYRYVVKLLEAHVAARQRPQRPSRLGLVPTRLT